MTRLQYWGHLLGDERSPAYIFEFRARLKSLTSPASSAVVLILWLVFTSSARRNLGGGKVTKILNFKEKPTPIGC